MLENDRVKCLNNHSFDFNKKGILCLLNNGNLKKSKIYNQELFLNRREFIENNFYNEIHSQIRKIIIDNFSDKKIKVLDLGCGEGTHVKKIVNNQNSIVIGFDYSKEAINLASSFINKNSYYFVGDVNNVPIKNNSIDCIIDFLSPYNSNEVNRVLKKDGLFIKVAPGINYLKELRKAYNIKDYEQNDLIKRKYENIYELEISNTYCITNNNLEKLIKMTPMVLNNQSSNIDKITIDLIIYVIKKVDCK